MSNLLARARAVAEQAANEYLASEAERIEQEAEGLLSLLTALALIAHGGEGGRVMIPNAALAAASEFSCSMLAVDGGLLISAVPAAEPKNEQRERLWELDVDLSSVRPPNYEDEHRNMEIVEAPSEPAETIPEEPMEQTPEARHARYLQAHGQPVVAQGAVRPHKRAWDDPEDLAFQEVPQGRVEVTRPDADGNAPDWYHERGEQLASGAGEGVSVRIGS